ncbi:hypothetical protein N0Y54_42950 [Nostoc punctiforme UO1]
MGWTESVARLLVKRTVAAAELENAMNVSAHWFSHSHATHALYKGTPR